LNSGVSLSNTTDGANALETHVELWIRESLQRAVLLVEQGKLSDAERIFVEALQKSEEFDKHGAITGLVLLDLHSFYEKQDRHQEASSTWERIRFILAGLR